ncbi:putative Brefeldin A resistance protein [Aureobasidium pullulans]|uniref:Brefeldin A resistance protein n=1 Tax=Aureobasidium pullulans TaxID=5580 RepID=A0AB74IZZ0_AURPU|nr:putative Brefeldin A resistance protein [Aureobasidium pullulans]
MSAIDLKPSVSTPTLIPTPAGSQSGDDMHKHNYPSDMEKSDEWDEMPEVQAIRRDDGSKSVHRKLGVTWNNLTVKGVGADALFNENVASQFLPGRLKGRRKTGKASLRTIIDQSSGCVKPGEMLLVLGRPGAGCTTLLKLLANRRSGFAEIDGEVNYGSLKHDEATKYQGQIVMNTEDEIFFPSLTVGQTIDFATRMKVPASVTAGFSSKEEARQASRDFLLKQLGISHTKNTKVGNEYIRGVSGGERKRVSIIETMATRGSVYCWDNSTRGLDASTALQYVKAVRSMSDIFGLASIITLYQAGNGIFDQFDKVLVLDEGKQLYYGPAKMAKQFMEDIGFYCPDGANVADYLTGVTVPTERQIREGFESKFPRNADQIVELYQASTIREQMEIEYDYPTTSEAKQRTLEFQQTIADEKTSDILTKGAPTTVGFGAQLKAAVQRQFQIIRGDINVLIIKQVSNLVQALTSGSLFYNAPDTSTGLFIKSGALFVSLLFNVLLAQSEVTDSFTGRPVLAKHKSFALYNPIAWCLAQIITDMPILLFQISAFSLVIYFMTGLTYSAGHFFIFWFIILISTMCMTAMFRTIGAAFKTFDDASKVAGLAVMATLLYNGYMIPKTEMHPWFVWLYWIDPLAYAYNALLSNEFSGKIIPCVGPNLVPNGPGYGSMENQACTGVRGAPVGATSVTGDQYLATLSYSRSDLWRNVGIVIVWWVFYVALTFLFTSMWKETNEQKGLLLVPSELAKHALPAIQDEESQQNEKSTPISSNDSSIYRSDNKLEGDLIRNTSVFSWKNLTYTVQTSDGPRVLLNGVHGFVKPGMLGALMGASGAGKTTLLDVLAQRKTDGTIHGSVLVDGRPLSISFQRSTGYCEQLDVHEPLTTVREALEFSALLRQPRPTSKEDKLKYVDVILDLLEMHDIADCLVGTSGGAGLSIEQRKRLTIGVELVAKPSVLVFLDEPTSGLDGQAAFNTVRFLKKLAGAGQAILVTIHQPSSQLFAQFDNLLLLAKGGNTAYFGEIGENASVIREYFGKHGAPCPEGKNPAEHMIDVISDTSKNWNETWLSSPEHDAMLAELDRLQDPANSTPREDETEGLEFAMPLWEQIKIVSGRANTTMYRNVDYINNKFAFHILTGLFAGFSFWQVGNSVSDMQQRLFAVFNAIFVAPGVIAQLQPLFIEKRDIYDAREKKSKMYSWIAFVTSLIVSEFPYLVICAVQFFFCYYYTVGFPAAASSAGAVFFVFFLYEFIYTGIGQFIAAYAPNAVAAALVNPLIIFTLVGFCGAVVPYGQITEFWRYWLYYMNPFNYLVGSMLVFTTWDIPVTCKTSELAIFDPPSSQTCIEYLTPYLNGMGAGTNLLNPNATAGCEVCQYRTGADYLATLNLTEKYFGWRDAGIVALFVFSGYGLVYLLMKLRTKKSKTAE